MTVAELIARLQNQDPEAEVHFAYNYGDYSRTTVAPKVRRIRAEYVKHSDYHNMPKIIDDEDEVEKSNTVIVLS